MAIVDWDDAHDSGASLDHVCNLDCYRCLIKENKAGEAGASSGRTSKWKYWIKSNLGFLNPVPILFHFLASPNSQH